MPISPGRRPAMTPVRARHCGSVRLVLRLHGECQEDCFDMSGPQRCPATDRRDTEGELAGRSRAVFFWKRQEIKGVGGTGPKGSVFY